MEIRVQTPWGSTVFTCIDGTYTTFTTEKANIELITNPIFGRMLFIDKVLKSSESDEKVYHSALARFVNIHYLPTTGLHYLIAGGVEGAMARDLLKYHPSKITMINCDRELIEYMKTEKWHKGSFSDSRVSIIDEDIFDFLDNDTIYDGIVLDILDPSIELIVKARNSLRKGSSLVANIGGDKKMAGVFCNKLREFSPIVEVMKASDIPSFQSDRYILCLRK